LRQALALFAPEDGPYLPGPQLAHDEPPVRPVPVPYVPAAQGLQAEGAGSAPAAQLSHVPAAHATHAVEPACAARVPLRQTLHCVALDRFAAWM
jgi:hypothetical protein